MKDVLKKNHTSCLKGYVQYQFFVFKASELARYSNSTFNVSTFKGRLSS